MKKHLLELLRDIAKALAIGVSAASITALLLFVMGSVHGGSLISGLELAKNGMYVILAFLLLIVSGFFLMSGKKRNEQTLHESWKKQFKHIGLKVFFMMISFGFLLLGVGIDWWMFCNI